MLRLSRKKLQINVLEHDEILDHPQSGSKSDGWYTTSCASSACGWVDADASSSGESLLGLVGDDVVVGKEPLLDLLTVVGGGVCGYGVNIELLATERTCRAFVHTLPPS
jgi:hypothetical protein